GRAGPGVAGGPAGGAATHLASSAARPAGAFRGAEPPRSSGQAQAAREGVPAHAEAPPERDPRSRLTPTRDLVSGRSRKARVWRSVDRANAVPRPAKPARQT